MTESRSRRSRTKPGRWWWPAALAISVAVMWSSLAVRRSLSVGAMSREDAAPAAPTQAGEDLRRPERPWWVRGPRIAAASLLFSLALSAVVTVLLVLRAPPAVAIEQLGIDLSMRLYVSVFGDVPAKDAKPTGYVFIDIDRDACQHFADDRDDCGAGTAVPTALITAFVEAIQTSGAAVVIIDVAQPDAPDERKAELETFAHAMGPWIVAPVRSRPAEPDPEEIRRGRSPGAVHLDETQRLASGRLRLAVTATSSLDGVVRHYPALVEARLPNGRSIQLPTAPFLAAALASKKENASALNCVFYRLECTVGKPLTIELGKHHYDLGSPAEFAEAYAEGRLFFSLRPGGARSATGAGHFERSLYEYKRLSTLLPPDGSRRIIPPDLKDKVVALGVGAAEGQDLHHTPLGVMPGPEIVLNATRAFVDFAPLETAIGDGDTASRAAQGWGVLVKKAAHVAPAAILWLFVWLAICFLRDKARRRGAVVRYAAGLAVVGMFVAGLAFAALLDIRSLTSELRSATPEGHAVDFLLPLVALGLEGYAEGAKKVSAAAEAAVEAVAAWASGLVARLRPSPSK